MAQKLFDPILAGTGLDRGMGEAEELSTKEQPPPDDVEDRPGGATGAQERWP